MTYTDLNNILQNIQDTTIDFGGDFGKCMVHNKIGAFCG